MKKTCLLSIFLVLFIFLSNAQTAQQLISVHNYNNLAAINAINNPPRGALAYNLDLNFLYYYNGINWVQIGSGNGSSNDGWSLTGNSITATNYLGTNNNQPIEFHVNNNPQWRLNANGTWHSYSSTVGIGQNVLSNSSGNNNVAIGNYSMSQNTTGINNVSIGNSSAFANLTGNNNVAVGTLSLRFNNAGHSNTAIGDQALRATKGSRNVAVGSNALDGNTTGNNNTAVGALAYQTGTYTNTTALGFNTQVSASNQIRIGANNITSIGGNVSWSVVSDKRFKENVKDDIVGLDFIMGLKAVSYNFNHKKKNRHHGFPDSLMTDKEYQKAYEVVQNGFLAQDVEALADSLNFNFHGIDKPKNEKDIYALRYAEFVVPLIKAMQEQQAMIIEQKETIKRLEKRIEKIEN